MSENKKLTLMDSDFVLFYLRLTSAYQQKIEPINFTRHIELNTAIKSRLLQYIVNKNFIWFRLTASQNQTIFNCNNEHLLNLINDKSLKIKLDDHPPMKKQLKNVLLEYVKFWFFWLLMLLALCTFSRKSKISVQSPGSILYGSLEAFNKDQKDYDRIDQYLFNSNKAGLSGCRFFIFKSDKTIHKLNENLIGSRFPEAAFVFFSHFGLWKRAGTLATHLFSLLQSHMMLLKNPCLSVIFSELASIHVFEILEREKLLNSIVFSTSNTAKHHISSYLNIYAKRHHVYYNIAPTNPISKNDKKPEIGTLEPFLTMPSFGTHWVWSDQDARLLSERYNKADVQVGGIPFLFYAPDCRPSVQLQPDFDIVIFDVTPLDLRKFNPYGLTQYYGRYETAVALVKNTIEAALSSAARNKLEPLRIALKPKRKDEKHHDMRYWEFLEKLALMNVHFTILDPSHNIFELFHPKTIFINRPFTSTAHLAAMSGCLSIYHDPNCEIVDTSTKIQNLFYTSGKTQLTKLLCKLTNGMPINSVKLK
jgi:polysaccharide biosynthesis PFTS motif protein